MRGSGDWSMRPVIGLLLFCWSAAAYAQPSFQPPTATELFNLRSRCAALGDKFLDGFFVTSGLTKSITSRYDPRTNHCYGELVIQNGSHEFYYDRTLYDLQTEELLASATINKGKKVGLGGSGELRGDLGFSAASEYIDKIIKEDR